MRPAYFSDYQLPTPAPALAWAWPDELTRHQAIYEELLASPDWASPAALPAPRRRAPSVRDLTRDLAGWSPPPGQRPAAKS